MLRAGGNRMSRARRKSTAAQSISDQPEARIESDCGPQRAAVADYVWGVPRPTTMVSACRFALRTPPKGYVRRSFLSFEEGPGRHAIRAAQCATRVTSMTSRPVTQANTGCRWGGGVTT